MNVDVQLMARDVDKKRGQRVASLLQQFTVALSQRVQKGAVAHEAAPNEEEGRTPGGRGLLGRGQEGAHLDPPLFSSASCNTLAPRRASAARTRSAMSRWGGQIKSHAAVAAQAEVDLRMGQG